MARVPQLHDLALARHAAHCGEHDAGLRACERLLARGLPPKIEAEVRAARTWYVPHAADLWPSWRAARIPEGLCGDRPAGWSLFNPSCLVHRNELLVLVRSSNYRIAADGSYVVPPEDQPDDGGQIWIRTKTLLLRGRFDHQGLAFTRDADLLIGPDYEANACRITGLEDLRLRDGADGTLVVSGTCLDAAGLPLAAGGHPLARIATATLLPDAAILMDFECLPEPFPNRYEKNWSPIAGRPDTWLYAAWEEGKVASVRRAEGSWIVTHHGASPLALRHLRGRSQLIPWCGGFLGVFGEATDDGRRMYDHRFVQFSADLTPLAWSSPFRVGPSRGVEFFAGLDQWFGNLVLSYGLRDEEAWVATLACDDVARSLRSIPC